MLAQQVQIEQRNKLAIAHVSAREMNGSDMQELVSELTNRMRFNNVQFFVLDLATVDLMSSDCLGALVAFLRDIEPMHGRVALANCRPNVAFLFKVTRLDTVFGLFDDVESAAEIAHG